MTRFFHWKCMQRMHFIVANKFQILLSLLLRSTAGGEREKTRNFIQFFFFRQPNTQQTKYIVIKLANPKMSCCTCASEVQIEMIYADKYHGDYLTSFSCMFAYSYSFVILLVFCCHLQQILIIILIWRWFFLLFVRSVDFDNRNVFVSISIRLYPLVIFAYFRCVISGDWGLIYAFFRT